MRSKFGSCGHFDVNNDHSDCWDLLEKVWCLKRDENLESISEKLEHLRGSRRGDLESYCEIKCVFYGRQENLNIKRFSLASSLPSTVRCVSVLCIDQTSPLAKIPAQP